jgi:hypothetical protein
VVILFFIRPLQVVVFDGRLNPAIMRAAERDRHNQ